MSYQRHTIVRLKHLTVSDCVKHGQNEIQLKLPHSVNGRHVLMQIFIKILCVNFTATIFEFVQTDT